MSSPNPASRSSEVRKYGLDAVASPSISTVHAASASSLQNLVSKTFGVRVLHVTNLHTWTAQNATFYFHHGACNLVAERGLALLVVDLPTAKETVAASGGGCAGGAGGAVVGHGGCCCGDGVCGWVDAVDSLVQ